MRALVLLLMVMLPTELSAAPKNKGQNNETLEQATTRFVQELTVLVEKAGYKKIKIAPHILIMSAEKMDGTPVGLVVNTNTMQAMEVEHDPNLHEIAQPSETYLPKLH